MHSETESLEGLGDSLAKAMRCNARVAFCLLLSDRRLVGGIKVFERRPSTELGAVRRNVDRIERRRPANEQAVELGAAESDVRDHFGDEDFADQRAVAVIAMDAFRGAGPDAAI